MLEPLIEKIRAAADGHRIMTDIHQIVATDRWFNFPKFQQTARYAAHQLKNAKLTEVEIIQFPADGKTKFGSWQIGLAWDAQDATLTITSGKFKGRVLADYRKIPCSLGMWSAPTPKEGIDAELIDVGAGASEKDYAGKNIRGKIVLANGFGCTTKALAHQHGAVGILTDWNSQPHNNPDAVGWQNGFADAPGGWPLLAGDSRMFRFAIPPRVGNELRALLKKGEKIRLHALVNTRIYEGEFPVITGLIQGQTKDEILILAHAFEQGAKDNASGVACMFEAVRILAQLIHSKKLPQPRRNIRALVTNECFGTIGYVQKFPDRAKRIVAAINLDEVGIDKNTIPEVQALYANPQSAASYLDAFMETLAETTWRSPNFNPYASVPYGGADNLIAVPSIGIPCIWMGCHGSRITWHNTTDIPAVMTEKQLQSVAVYAAAYLYFLANAGEKEATWLAGVALAKAKNEMSREHTAAHARWLVANNSEKRKILAALAQRFDYLLTVHDAAISAITKLASKTPTAQHLAEMRKHATELLTTLAGKTAPPRLGAPIISPFKTAMPKVAHTVRPISAVAGPITYDGIDDREGHRDPRRGTPVNTAVDWGNGKRTIAEVVALAEHELRLPLPNIAEEILWLIQKGLVKDARKPAPR